MYVSAPAGGGVDVDLAACMGGGNGDGGQNGGGGWNGVASIKDDAVSGSGHVQPSRHALIGRVTVCAARWSFK